MGRKPALGLLGACLTGLALTGCTECFCNGGSRKPAPPPVPPPSWTSSPRGAATPETAAPASDTASPTAKTTPAHGSASPPASAQSAVPVPPRLTSGAQPPAGPINDAPPATAKNLTGSPNTPIASAIPAPTPTPPPNLPASLPLGDKPIPRDDYLGAPGRIQGTAPSPQPVRSTSDSPPVRTTAPLPPPVPAPGADLGSLPLPPLTRNGDTAPDPLPALPTGASASGLPSLPGESRLRSAPLTGVPAMPSAPQAIPMPTAGTPPAP